MDVMSRPFGVTEIKKLKDGKMLVTGRAMELDVPLLNGTVYGKKLWEKDVIPAYQPYIDNRMAYGMLDHPLRDFKDISTKLKSVYGRVVKLFISDDGKFLMATVLIYDNEVGKNLQYFLENGTVGVSTRGKGKTKEVGNTRVVLKYNFIGLDFVAMPSSIKALYTATTGKDDWDTLVEGVEFNTEEEMFGRVDLIEEVKRVADLDVSSYFEFKDEVNDDYICDLSGNCKLKSLMENNIIGMEKEDILMENEIEEVKGEEVSLVENVADMLVPQTELKLSSFESDIKKMSRDDIEKALLAVQLEKEADKYLKLPHGEFLRKVFIAMSESRVDVETVESVVTLFNTEIAKDSESDNNKVKLLETELAKMKEQLDTIKLDANKKMQTIINENQSSVEQLKADALAREGELKKQHLDQVDLLKDTVSSVKVQAANDIKDNKDKVVELKDTISTVKEEQEEQINDIKNDIKETEESINQYYSLIESKNEVITNFETENTKLKNDYDGLLNEIGQITESYGEMKSLSESLILEKEQSVTLYEDLTHELKSFKSNIALLESKVSLENSEKESLLAERIELNDNLVQLQSNFDVVESKWTAKLEKLMTEKMGMAKEMAKTLDFLSEYKVLLEQAESKEVKFNEQRDDFINKADETNELITLMEDKLDVLDEGIVSLTEEKNEIMNKSISDNKALLEVRDQLEMAEGEIIAVKDENEILNENLLEASDYIEELKVKNTRIQDKNAELQEKMSIMDVKLAKIRARIKNKESQKDNSSRIKRKNEELNSKINIKQKDVEKKTDNLIAIYESFDVEEVESKEEEPIARRKGRSFRNAFKSSVIDKE